LGNTCPTIRAHVPQLAPEASQTPSTS